MAVVGLTGDTDGAAAPVLFPVCRVSVTVVEVRVWLERPHCREGLSWSPE